MSRNVKDSDLYTLSIFVSEILGNASIGHAWDRASDDKLWHRVAAYGYCILKSKRPHGIPRYILTIAKNALV